MTNGGSNGNKSDHSTSVSAEATPVQEKSPEPQQLRQQPVVPMPNAAAQPQPMFPPPPTMTFVPPTTQQPSINFLQESQIGKTLHFPLKIFPFFLMKTFYFDFSWDFVYRPEIDKKKIMNEKSREF